MLKKSQEILIIHRIHPLGNVAIMSLKAALLSKGIIIIHRRCLLVVSFFTYHVENPWFNPGRRHKSLWSCGRKAIWCKKKKKRKKICWFKHVKLPAVSKGAAESHFIGFILWESWIYVLSVMAVNSKYFQKLFWIRTHHEIQTVLFEEPKNPSLNNK